MELAMDGVYSLYLLPLGAPSSVVVHEYPEVTVGVPYGHAL